MNHSKDHVGISGVDEIRRIVVDPKSVAQTADPVATAETAHQYAWDSREGYGGQSFEEAEPQLRLGWESCEAGGRVPWEEVRAAVRDAWYCSR